MIFWVCKLIMLAHKWGNKSHIWGFRGGQPLSFPLSSQMNFEHLKFKKYKTHFFVKHVPHSPTQNTTHNTYFWLRQIFVINIWCKMTVWKMIFNGNKKLRKKKQNIKNQIKYKLKSISISKLNQKLIKHLQFWNDDFHIF